MDAEKRVEQARMDNEKLDMLLKNESAKAKQFQQRLDATDNRINALLKVAPQKRAEGKLVCMCCNAAGRSD